LMNWLPELQHLSIEFQSPGLVLWWDTDDPTCLQFPTISSQYPDVWWNEWIVKSDPLRKRSSKMYRKRNRSY
jgi:hypothetical protein